MESLFVVTELHLANGQATDAWLPEIDCAAIVLRHGIFFGGVVEGEEDRTITSRLDKVCLGKPSQLRLFLDEIVPQLVNVRTSSVPISSRLGGIGESAFG